METLHVAVCDDDEVERKAILDILDKSNFTLKVSVYECGEDFISSFKPYKFDIIFMDIFMKNMTGIDVITEIRNVDHNVSVAFITSSKDFTLESYRLDAVKYIEKPATPKSIIDALQLAQLKRKTEDVLEIKINNVTQIYTLSRIVYLEQKARNLLIHLQDGEVISANKKLIDVESQLVGKGFLRCHKSYIVNSAYIRGIDRELCLFEMTEGSKVYIRKRGFWEVQRDFEEYLFKIEREVNYE
ncbi:MAG: LytTR family DNA-binding domain-containing protein [Clostridia bacterium]